MGSVRVHQGNEGRWGTILYGVRPVLSSLIYRRECDTIPRVSDTMDTSTRYVESPNDSVPPPASSQLDSALHRYEILHDSRIVAIDVKKERRKEREKEREELQLCLIFCKFICIVYSRQLLRSDISKHVIFILHNLYLSSHIKRNFIYI